MLLVVWGAGGSLRGVGGCVLRVKVSLVEQAVELVELRDGHEGAPLEVPSPTKKCEHEEEEEDREDDRGDDAVCERLQRRDRLPLLAIASGGVLAILSTVVGLRDIVVAECPGRLRGRRRRRRRGGGRKRRSRWRWDARRLARNRRRR